MKLSVCLSVCYLSVCLFVYFCLLSTLVFMLCLSIVKYTKSKEGAKIDPLVNKQPVKVEELKVENEMLSDDDDRKLKKLAKLTKRGKGPGPRGRGTQSKTKKQEAT